VEGFLILMVVIAIAVPVVVIVILFGHFSLRGRLARAEQSIRDLQDHTQMLERRLRDEVAEPIAPDAEKSAPQVTPQGERDPVKTKNPPPLPDYTPPPPPRPSEPPRATPVADILAAFGSWLQQNWFYAVSALSLALAGIFLVQYGMENGLLPPRARVFAALVFGSALVGAGEYIRRRFGDDEQSVTAYLPSVFSGAGIVTLFGAILSARLLYDLIGGGPAMTGMVAIALLAVVLGWLHGPLLAAVGVIGAFAAPLVLGSSSSDASLLFVYFTIVAALGLGVDTIRRWSWVSALTVVLGYLAGWGLWSTSRTTLDTAAIVYFAGLPLLAIIIPARSLMPDHAGRGFVSAMLRDVGDKTDGRRLPEFPTLLAFGTVAASAFLLFTFWHSGEVEIWFSVSALAGLTMVLIIWSTNARALQELAALPGGVLLLSVFAQAEGRSATFRAFQSTYEANADAGWPWAVTGLVALAVLISILAVWRSLSGGALRYVWAVAGAVYAPAMAILLEVSWRPGAVIGAYPWGLHAAALAAIMVVFAERFARHDGEHRLRVSFAVMSALSCLAFAFVVVLSTTALTLALAVTVVTAAALDQRWNLRPLMYFIVVGVAVLGYRLVVDPGLEFGRYGYLPEMLLAYGGTFAGFVVALYLLRGLDRPAGQVVLDSAAWSTGGMLLSLLILRWIDAQAPAGSSNSHWSLGLIASIWLGLGLAQLQRTCVGGALYRLRFGLAGLFFLFGAGGILTGLSASNPLFNRWQAEPVLGPALINTLAAAYLLPGLILLLGAMRLQHVDKRLRFLLAVSGGGLAVFWIILVIRHFWQGAEGVPIYRGFGQPELYSYTIALLATGAGLFYQSLARRSAIMRKAGLAVIGLAVAKVFLIDISGLEGLTRVFSLLALGLSLAGLAWLNRWAKGTYDGGSDGGHPPALPDAPSKI